MKKLLLFLLLLVSTTSFSQVDYSKKIDLSLLEKSIVNKINEYRTTNGVDSLLLNDTIKTISNVECQYVCDNGMVQNPDLIDNLKNFYGDNVYYSYNSNIVTKWSLNKVVDWDDVEKRMAEGYIIQYNLDNRENSILMSKKEIDKNYREYVGVTCKIKGDTIYVSQVIYITK